MNHGQNMDLFMCGPSMPSDARRVLEEVVDMTHCDPQEVILAWLNNDSRNDIYISYTLWFFNIAMENGPFIDGLPIKHGDFPWLC